MRPGRRTAGAETMPMRRLSAAVSPLLAGVDWAFSPPVPGIDLFLGAVSACWFSMMTLRPAVFDQGSFVGLQWAPDAVWIVFVGTVVLLHLAGLFAPDLIKLRAAACLLSAWYWLCVSVSLSRDGIVPGTWTYGLIGLMALTSAIYVSGRALRLG